MSNLFKPKMPAMPTPAAVAPEVTKAQDRQEKRLEAQEQSQAKQLAAQRRARQYGGRRMLMSGIRGGTADDETTLG
jgi:hypothetical protein